MFVITFLSKSVDNKKYLILFLVLPLVICGAGFFLFKNFISQFRILFSIKSLFIIILVSPILEEIAFRGLIQDLCIKKFYNHKIMAIIFVNIMFSLLHFNNNQNIIYLVLVFLSGMIFSYSKLMFNKLSVPILLHAYYNIIFIIMLWYNN